MTFWIARDKWGGRPHYRHVGVHLGDDDTGSWYTTAPGTPIYKGDEPWGEARWYSVVCIAEGREWTAWFIAPDADSWFDVYCDVVTPVSFLVDRTSCVDLDLDVVRRRDGTVEIIDRDEFEENRALFGYPDDVVASAERAAEEVARMIVAAEPPFDDGRAERWLEAARP